MNQSENSDEGETNSFIDCQRTFINGAWNFFRDNFLYVLTEEKLSIDECIIKVSR